MEQINPNSHLNEPRTDEQTRCLIRFYRILQVPEEAEVFPDTKWEARNLIYDLRNAIQRRNLRRKHERSK